jgi:hypothetical protein
MENMTKDLNIETMVSLIQWCKQKDYSTERTRQLIIDWNKASGELIPDEIIEKEFYTEDDW